MKKVLGLLIALGLMVSPVFAAAEQAAGNKTAAPAAGEEKKPAKEEKKPAKKATKATKAKKAVKKEEKKEEMKQEQKQQ
jgi:outer membrane biosynthesis protein TonB